MLFPVIALRLRCASTGVFQGGRAVARLRRFRGGGSKEMYRELKNLVLLGSRTESQWDLVQYTHR